MSILSKSRDFLINIKETVDNISTNLPEEKIKKLKDISIVWVEMQMGSNENGPDIVPCPELRITFFE